jgi:hypothetical protein
MVGAKKTSRDFRVLFELFEIYRAALCNKGTAGLVPLHNCVRAGSKKPKRGSSYMYSILDLVLYIRGRTINAQRRHVR